MIVEAGAETTAEYALKIHDLHKSYGATAVLNGVNIRVREGEVVSLIGSSGSGKSTLLRCVNFLETPTSGAIDMYGEAISVAAAGNGLTTITNKSNIPRFRTVAGMVFQSFNLWPHLSVLSNVTESLIWVKKMPKKDAIEVAMSVLEKVGMAEKRDAYPAHLSGGQQQRVAIARVLAMQPRIMLCDEPTSALDPELVGEVLKVIRNLAAEGNTILLVTHEMRFSRDVSSRVLFLHKGLVEQDGSPSEIFGNPRSERLRRFIDTTGMN
ncbi:amino acid ABC transporter ATP-binding protein [Rhizobium tubonense]|uniref:Histidine/lysine/arginine/ornithine ABC transporter ATP-binding protein n=1 Tax=Rhizobium tubonense TaxID=484088 RepID=A0A2W4ETZ6_9HYPH|nr:amino acid ABC transporter ATP-binding protein [Rhizobium tubonense]PZM14313.1 histidine/lysine/arginine/ornithine ABC transporter ATP-binding protein [Rhizobium tubonense]